ncbi:Carboxymuconolactone decarboxylase family protein [Faunimonas pinastri]|uniref:Carboxymuconolactone decarboxylase family protein n=1 Tax=Faunimonas pinastri TaxID=1855383 RepID=A0A1H9EC46_9HYPH|nr:carboxymuconolactone decarboxylase family protein [Faunimonas pinastri]SEQ23314.1 Carboxymuconolactone decarboxylase family protein [Faunimonas pinastri]
MTEDETIALKADIMKERGYWSPFHQILLERAPEFLKAYLLYQAGPARSGLLPAKLCELVYVAIDISVNHMYERGGRRHMEFALKAGATAEEVLQTILITTALAAQQPLELGYEILAEELGAAGGAPLGDDARADRDAYRQAVGNWPGSGDLMLSTSLDLARGYLAYGTAAWQAGPLSPKEKELIALAVCAAPTALFKEGMRCHVKAALTAGASPAEIGAILQLAGAISIHTCTIGVPAFEDALKGSSVE